jgi:hypothetical protein
MPLHVGWHLAVRDFRQGITRESRLKPPGLNLIEGISPCLILWGGACPDWLSPTNGDPASTHILTQHCGVRSQTIRQLENLGTPSTRQVPIVQLLWVI